MQEFIVHLAVEPGANILVPLCGKSLDMQWLANKGHRVIGIELSEVAARDFFVENHLEHEVIRKPGRVIFRGENIEIRCMDFFLVELTDLPRIDAVYDRASLIALPPEMRRDYACHLSGLLGNGVRSLLVTLDYPQEEMRGPPFCVTPEEVRQLFAGQYRIEHLHSEDCLAIEPRFRKKGLTRFDEHVFILRKGE